ncbi:hypothetical protein L1987_18216 [Smallanthus sonchifolius]|uniref:Uncharacterized protein n=1 Tax=Smallanthus sonchifolius TaxID=185202 RepID=A0ACB9J169_9ASTR|nr:hypothetical protein L1987_18216 [Smallanthus sonchifolius]
MARARSVKVVIDGRDGGGGSTTVRSSPSRELVLTIKLALDCAPELKSMQPSIKVLKVQQLMQNLKFYTVFKNQMSKTN